MMKLWSKPRASKVVINDVQLFVVTRLSARRVTTPNMNGIGM